MRGGARRTAHSLVRVLGFTTAILSVSTLARGECTKDTDCKGDRVCTAGACVDPAPAAVRTPADTSWEVELPPVVAQQTPAPVVASPTPKSSQTRARGHAHDVGARTRSAGTGIFVVGLLLDAGGAGMYWGGSRAKCDLGKSDCNTLAQAGIGVLIFGGLLTVVGLSVWVVGSSQGPVAGARKRGIVPYVEVGLSGGEAGFQF